MNSRSSILLIYTGGTIGMMEDPESGALVPLNFNALNDQVPELRRFSEQIDVVSFDQPIDSSDVGISTWQKLAHLIEINYSHYDGFVILHGTDTMAYSASALSFMLEDLGKPVIFTGSQLPIGRIRTDGRENLVTAIEIAGEQREGRPIIQEVALYFKSRLFRGNRTHKYSTENFDAFESANLAPLAEAGINIFYNQSLLWKSGGNGLKVHNTLDPSVGVIRLFPGMSQAWVETALVDSTVKALVLETFGSGNAPRVNWLVEALEEAGRQGKIVVNVSQCNKGFVEQGRYATSTALQTLGVLGAADMTTEAALTKVMFLLGQHLDRGEFERRFSESLRGELTMFSPLS